MKPKQRRKEVRKDQLIAKCYSFFDIFLDLKYVSQLIVGFNYFVRPGIERKMMNVCMVDGMMCDWMVVVVGCIVSSRINLMCR